LNQPVTNRELFVTFTKIALSGFGGVLPWIRRAVVEKKHWLTAGEFNSLIGICQLVPGPNVVNLAICIGARFTGVRGSISAVLGMMTAPVALVILIAYLYDHYGRLPEIQGLLRGICAVGIGLIASTGFKMLKNELTDWPMLATIAVCILASAVLHLSLLTVVAITLPLGLIAGWIKTKK
jgi:chromate transporter